MIKNIFLLFVLLLIFGCKNNSSVKSDKNKTVKIEQQPQDVKYVTAKSGLIYRNKPKGKKLGKFEFNEKIKIYEHTNVFQQIKNGDNIIKGEWLSVKLENKNVYIFDGFLSNTKTKINLKDVKLFMGNVIWISEEFKTTLEETKILSKAYNCEFYSDIAYDDEIFNEPALFGDKNFMEPKVLKIDKNLLSIDYHDAKTIKITAINNKTLIIEKENKKYKFTRSNIKKNPMHIVGGVDSASFHFFIDWFGKSSYVFKNENGTKNYNSKNVNYWLHDNIIEINEKTYNIDKVVTDTYFMSEIKVVWQDEIDYSTSKTGKKATLRKIKKTINNNNSN